MNNKKYKLFLVNSFQKYKQYATQFTMARIMGKIIVNTSLALPTLAALTPDNYHIRIIDEEIESIPKRIKPDIVGFGIVFIIFLTRFNQENNCKYCNKN